MAKILVVDDEEAVVGFMTEILSRDNHVVVSAGTGKEGFEKYLNEDFDLVITDLVMPEQSGIDMIIEMQKITPNIKVIAISGGGGIKGRFDYLPIAKLIGAQKIVKKPFHISEIKEAISSVL